MSAPVVLVLAAATTWLLRVSFITLVPAARLPDRVRRSLDDVAPAVMAALVVTHLSHGAGPAGLVSTDAVAALVAAAVAWSTRSLAWTAAAGVGAAALLRLL